MKYLIFTGLLNFAFCATLMAQNIGINTPTPNAALDVRSTGSTSATYGVLVSNTTNDTSLVVSDNGNVGIGTTLPAYTLDVQSSNPIAARFSGRVTGQNAVNGNEFITLQQAGTLSGSGSQANGTMFSTESTSAMRFHAAIMHCRNLTEGGFTNWRMPRYDEFLDMLQNDAIPIPTLSGSRSFWLRGGEPSYGASSSGYSFETVFYFTGNHTTSYYASGYIDYNNSTAFVICVR